MKSEVCTRTRDLDWSAWLTDIGAPEWREFVEHYPWCVECSIAVERINALELALREGPADLGEPNSAHPEPSLLARYSDAVEHLGPQRRREIELHVRGCTGCSSELRALQSFDFSRLKPDHAGSSNTCLDHGKGVRASSVPIISIPKRFVPVSGRLVSLRSASRRFRVPLTGLAAAAVLVFAFFFGRGHDQDDRQAIRISKSAPVPEGIDSGTDSPLGDEILVAAVLDLGPAAYDAPSGIVGTPWYRSRVGFRGRASSGPTLYAMAPSHVGHTHMNSPTLWWLLSEPTTAPIDFSIIETGSHRHLVDLSLSGPTEAGFHRISLSDLGVRLERDVVYEWRVGLHLNSELAAAATSSEGAILRLGGEPSNLRLATRSPQVIAKQWHHLAGEGLWYETFDFISDLAKRHPEIEKLGQIRAQFMKEVGLEVPSVGSTPGHIQR